MRDPIWRGIAKHGQGWRASVSRGSRDAGILRKHFAYETDPRVMQAWRADVKASLRLKRRQRATMGAFSVDAKRYLKAVAAMPTLKWREREIAVWCSEFGTRERSEITSAEIRAIRDRLLTEPRSATNAKPFGPNKVNKLLRALSNLYAVLDAGTGAANPVRDVPEAEEPDLEPRALDYGTIAAILAKLPEARSVPRGTPPKVSKSTIRLRCLAYCPITPKQLSQLQPAHLDLARHLLRMPARRKGKGARAVWVPLLPEAVTALTDFDRHGCYGSFAMPSLRRAFRRAAKAAGVRSVTPYMLRHSFATMAYRATGSLEAVGALLQHAHRSTTQRYAVGAEHDVLAQTMHRVAAHFQGTTVRDNGALHSETFLDISAHSERGKEPAR